MKIKTHCGLPLPVLLISDVVTERAVERGHSLGAAVFPGGSDISEDHEAASGHQRQRHTKGTVEMRFLHVSSAAAEGFVFPSVATSYTFYSANVRVAVMPSDIYKQSFSRTL